MARKAKPHEEELPFVALMDTMTNVVGVLIIVLVMIGIGLAKSVQKVLSELPMVSVEEHKILKDEMGQYDAKRDPAEVQLEVAKLQDELKKIEDELHALEGEKSKNPNVMVDLDKLAKELEEKRKDRDRRKLEAEKMLADIDKMKVQLDNTPPTSRRRRWQSGFPTRSHCLITQQSTAFLSPRASWCTSTETRSLIWWRRS